MSALEMILTLVSVFAAVCFGIWLVATQPGQKLTPLANVAEGRWPGCKTYKATAAITSRYLVGKIGADSAHIAVAGASDIPIGFITDEAEAAEDLVNVNLLGTTHSTQLGVASGPITLGAFVVADASGKVRALPGTSGTYYIIGRALNAPAADGDIAEIDPCAPIQRVV
jgi:hypothetical protein